MYASKILIYTLGPATPFTTKEKANAWQCNSQIFKFPNSTVTPKGIRSGSQLYSGNIWHTRRTSLTSLTSHIIWLTSLPSSTSHITHTPIPTFFPHHSHHTSPTFHITHPWHLTSPITHIIHITNIRYPSALTFRDSTAFGDVWVLFLMPRAAVGDVGGTSGSRRSVCWCWNSFFVEGTILGNVEGWVMLLRLMYWTFHVQQLSDMNVVVPLCFASHGYSRAMYGTLHVSWINTL